MKKLLIFVAVLAGVALLLKRLVRELPNMDWEKRFEAMPDNAPPKWMFRNIAAIRENTEQIIELLGGAEPGSAGEPSGEVAGATTPQ